MSKKKAPPALPQPSPQVSILNCTFLAVGRHAWDPAVSIDRDRVVLANSLVASPDLLKWRYFLQYKTRNLRRDARRLIRTALKKKRNK